MSFDVWTNREQLLAELCPMTSAQLVRLLSEDLREQMDRHMCEDCERDHGGECPVLDGELCVVGTEQWLDKECSRSRLIDMEGDGSCVTHT